MMAVGFKEGGISGVQMGNIIIEWRLAMGFHDLGGWVGRTEAFNMDRTHTGG